jgi:hypothetical protein
MASGLIEIHYAALVDGAASSYEALLKVGEVEVHVDERHGVAPSDRESRRELVLLADTNVIEHGQELRRLGRAT